VRNHEPVKLVKAQVLLDLPLKATLEKLPEKEFIQLNRNFGRSLDFQNVATRMDNVLVEK